MFKVNEGLKIDFYNAVLRFYLIIGLKMENIWKYLFNANKVAKQ